MSNPRLARAVAGLALALALAALLPACVHQVSSSTGVNGAPGIAPQLTVESFLRAANCVASEKCASKPQDLETMSRLFGTRDGSLLLRDPRADVEKRMYALASFLQSQDYHVQGQNIVPGRVDEAVEIVVRLTEVNGKVVTVPIIVVKDGKGNWLVERIEMAALTQRQ